MTRASFWLSLHKQKEALVDLKRARRLNPSQPGIDLQFAEAYAAGNEVEKARTALSRYIANNPTERQSGRVRRLRERLSL